MVLKGVKWSWNDEPFLTLQGSMALLLDLGWFLTHSVDGLERNLLSSAGVGAWCCFDIFDSPASHRRNIPTLFWILSGILALGSHSSPVHEETST